ncbi:MAG: response regulator [Gemmatimonadota bacterium]
MVDEKTKALVQSIKKIPLFRDLSPSQVQKLLRLCEAHTYRPGQQVCGSDSPSNEMHILVAGELEVLSADRVRVATVAPVTTVGEMGVISHQPRSAHVVAVQISRVLTIAKPQFDSLLRNNSDVQLKVFRNIIHILATKIVTDNVRTRDYVLEKMRSEKLHKEQGALVRRALELLEERGGMTREEARAQLAAAQEQAVLRVLVVDDEPGFRQFAREALTTVEVLEAEDGEGALAVIEARLPDLVITDIRMPGMDGVALRARLRELYPDLRVMAISGYVGAEEVGGGGFDGFLEKPVKLNEFRQLVESALLHPRGD